MPYRPRVDLDRHVHDQLILRTVPGAVDYLAEDVRALGVPVLRRYPDGLLVDYSGPLRPLAASRYFDVVMIDPQALDASLKDGVLSALLPGDDADRIDGDRVDGADRVDGERADGESGGGAGAGAVRFRVGDLGEDRWAVRDRLESGYGWRNSPNAWDVNVEPGGAEIGALYLTQRFGELLRTPASTNPVVAAVLVRLAKIEPGQTVLDPFCGAGTLLVQAAEMARPGRMLGFDVQNKWLRMAADNLRGRGVAALLARADAARLPVATGSADRVLANLPFGKRVGSHRVNAAMYPAALAEIARVLPSGGRAVLLTDDKRLFREAVQRTRLIRVIKEIVLARGGLHPSAYVVSKRGR
jgi:predicted RNA methylase